MRLDKFLKISRVIKRRTVANEAADNGRVSVNEKWQNQAMMLKPEILLKLNLVIKFQNSKF